MSDTFQAVLLCIKWPENCKEEAYCRSFNEEKMSSDILNVSVVRNKLRERRFTAPGMYVE